jgi:hypothetical protein
MAEIDENRKGFTAKGKYIWSLTAIVIVITLALTIYLFQPYIGQYPDSYLRIYTIISAVFLLLLAPILYFFLFKSFLNKYVVAYFVILIIPMGYLFDIDALFFIPWVLELVFTTITIKKVTVSGNPKNDHHC